MEWIIVSAAILILIVVALPYVLGAIVKSRIDKALTKSPGYSGTLQRVYLSILSRKITLHDIHVESKEMEDGKSLMFSLRVPRVTGHFTWGSVFRKKPDATIVVDEPELVLANIPSRKETSTDDEKKTNAGVSALRDAIIDMMPFRVSVDVRNGMIHYTRSSQPSINVTVTGVHISVKDFSNRLEQIDPCFIDVAGFLCDGAAGLSMKLYPLEPTFTFDLNAELKAINLVMFNDVFRTFGKVDVNSGTLDLFTEVAVADNVFKGYIKPIIKDLDFVGIEDKNDGFFRRLWERAVAAGVYALENKQGELATRIPLEGRLDDPRADVLTTIGGLIRNAFFKPFKPSLENIVRLPFNLRSAGSKARNFLSHFLARRESKAEH